MDKLKYIKLENEDGSYSDSIPLAVDSDHVDVGGTNLTTTLATKASVASVASLSEAVSGLASGSPKGTYLTTAALINANPATGVYIITENGHIYSWTKDGEVATDLGAYLPTEIDESKLNNYVALDPIHSEVNCAQLQYGHWNGSSISSQYGTQYQTIYKMPILMNHLYYLKHYRILDVYTNDNVRKRYDNTEHSDVYYTAEADGYLICSFYTSDNEAIIFDITNWTQTQIDNISLYSGHKIHSCVDLSDRVMNSIQALIPRVAHLEKPYTIEKGKYIVNNGSSWETSSSLVDTKRYGNLNTGDVVKVHGYQYKNTTVCSLWCRRTSDDAIRPFWYLNSPSPQVENPTVIDYTFTIPDFPAWANPEQKWELFVTTYERRFPSTDPLPEGQMYSMEALTNPVDESTLEDALATAIETATADILANANKSNILYGKKYVACGDSFTHGDFNGYTDPEGHTGTSSDAYDPEWQMYKTYPYWIAKRNNMTLINEAVNGSTMTNTDDGTTSRFSYVRYKNIPADADYITLKFGINDSASHQNMPIGTIEDSDTNTFYGAWNTVLSWLIENRPEARIGILIGNGLSGSRDEPYCEAMRLIAKKFGIPYLDEDLDDQIPLTFRTNKEVDPAIAQLRQNQYRVSSSNGHPNVACHKIQSEFVEDFLRRL